MFKNNFNKNTYTLDIPLFLNKTKNNYTGKKIFLLITNSTVLISKLSLPYKILHYRLFNLTKKTTLDRENMTNFNWLNNSNLIFFTNINMNFNLLLLRLFGLLTFTVIITMFWPICPLALGVSCQTQESTQNLKLNPLFEPHELTVPVLLAMTRYKC